MILSIEVDSFGSTYGKCKFQFFLPKSFLDFDASRELFVIFLDDFIG